MSQEAKSLHKWKWTRLYWAADKKMENNFSGIFLPVSRIYLPDNIGHFIEKLDRLVQR